MGKNILQRLAECLRDLTAQGKAAPPSAGGPGDKSRSRLIAIEGGKGTGEWDGNERRKPCAVIGIPYSSDAAENTVEEKEECVMKKITKYMCAFGTAVVAVFALGACGGGGGSTSGSATSAGTTGFTSGVVTGFGTLHLGTGQNEKVFDVRNAVMKRVDDTVVDHNVNHDAHEDNVVFRIGMRVEIFHGVDDNNAVEVRFKNDLEGPITAKPSVVAGATFDVLGVPVLVDANTNFDDSIGGSGLTLGGLVVGNVIEVSGLFDNNGVLHATFIEGKHASSAGRTFEIKGKIAGLGGTAPNQTFTVNGVSFTTNGATTLRDLAGGLGNGLFVEVKTTSTTAPFLATRIEGPAGDFETPEDEVMNAQKASVEGFVTGLTGTTPNFSFTLNGISVTTSSATTAGLGLVTAGAHVEAEGPVVGGVIHAAKITSRP